MPIYMFTWISQGAFYRQDTLYEIKLIESWLCCPRVASWDCIACTHHIYAALSYGCVMYVVWSVYVWHYGSKVKCAMLLEADCSFPFLTP